MVLRNYEDLNLWVRSRGATRGADGLIQVAEGGPTGVGRLVVIGGIVGRTGAEDELCGGIRIVVGLILEARVQLLHGQSRDARDK